MRQRRPSAGEVRAVLFDLYGTLVDIVLDETSPAFGGILGFPPSSKPT